MSPDLGGGCMAERIEEAEESGPEAAAAGADTVAAVMAAALKRSRKAGAQVDPEFDAFLRDQRRLVNLQTEHLHEQRELTLSRLRLGRWKDRVGLALQLMTAGVGAAIALGVAVMAWQAHEDHGVSIAAFP